MKAISVDNFRMLRPGTICDHFLGHNASAEEAASRLGVEFIHVDLVDWEPPFQEDSLDVVMSFDNIEHLSHSPRRVYTHMIRCLKPGGMVLIGAPNAANLAKRVRMVLGRNVFARMDEWYMHDGFIGHIREPIVSDLRLIAEDLGIHVEAVVGRNWLGLSKLQGRMQLCGNLLDRALRCHPAFCSDIYLLATKPR
jgi:SAM-dependent methyltransferase